MCPDRQGEGCVARCCTMSTDYYAHKNFAAPPQVGGGEKSFFVFLYICDISSKKQLFREKREREFFRGDY